MLLWAFCFTCSFHKANSVSHNKGTRLNAIALPVPRGVTLPDSHSRCSVLTLMLRLITERWNRLLRKHGGRDERNQSWHVNAWQGSVEANIYIISGSALASVYNWSHDCISSKRRVEGKEEEEKASHWTLEFHSHKSDRRENLVYIWCFHQPCVISLLSRRCQVFLFHIDQFLVSNW